MKKRNSTFNRVFTFLVFLFLYAPILVVILFVSSSDFGAQTTVDKYKILCDAFTIPGLLMLMFAAMLSISNEGGAAQKGCNAFWRKRRI